MSQPYPFWSREELEKRLARSTALFRENWSKDALQQGFRELQAGCAAEVRALLAASDNLAKLVSEPEFFAEPSHKPLLAAARYTTVPLLSEDNFKVLADGRPGAEVIVEFLNLDRFTWMEPGAPAPSQAEIETAVTATAELMALQRASTAKRTAGAKSQEEAARDCLTAVGLTHVAPALVRERARKLTSYTAKRGIEPHNLRDLLSPGEYTSEFLVAGHKSDVPVLLPSGVLLTLECKVSNSATNSVKRVIRETDGKRRAWREMFGTGGVLTGAVIAGVFSITTLVNAQEEGMLLFFDHEMEALAEFVRQGGKPRAS